ncbi:MULTISPECIES: hypothetical protein [Deefgea]|uniref:Uncharacterized protein n=1 Tax=Deefgea chitinilytica TaxID=570276 RepID=A0ABS2C9C6_9NEIS|nr:MULTISPECIES: hypothetical protein [Deefgea]MBM5570657.1 hypothetical protein [Deefgea chitinilytica]MBM9887886.1 hypothetical protein [Deefgea sp. CFH1-16]
MHILVENTATHQELPSAEQKNKKELLKYIQDAMNIQGEIREYISQKTGIYGEAAEAFNAVTTPNHAIFEKEPYSKVQVCIKAISKASEYLLINKNL